MGFSPNEIVTVSLDCAGWHKPYVRDITRHQLGQLLLSLDDMAADTEEGAPDDVQEWPSPDEAYANAPHLVAEITTLQATAADPETELDREWRLRHAALLDRVALHIACFDNDPSTGPEAEEAEATAVLLLDLDQAPRDYDPRAYVRQQYALWASSK
ncbi:hypothetical protein ACIGW8_10125 [Streptomyces sioyaensis]|uniref:hypothetical protein n=1 Tax=Streptomyces sioyaensis TaxID=67364 RepID=UPI0037D39782